MNRQSQNLLLGMGLNALIQAQDTPAAQVEALRGSADVLFGLAGGKTLGEAIEHQEAAGQAQVVSQDLLPVNAPWDKLESLGFKRLGEGDGVLCPATLPPGWSKRVTDHSMWSDVLDERGRVRASMFYKAAFYDRDAHLSLTQRYSAGARPVGGWENAPRYPAYEGYANVESTEIYVSEERVKMPTDCADRSAVHTFYESKKVLEESALAWLADRFPDWRNPLAYWD